MQKNVSLLQFEQNIKSSLDVGGDLKEIFVSPSPKGISPDCPSQHAPHLCVNTTLV